MHAVRIDANASGASAGAYLAKGGDWTPAEEVARGDLKTSRTGSRTPLQMLADYYQTGDTRYRDFWHEYSRVTKGLAAVRWSRGLRAVILGSVAASEKTDAELAAGDVDGELVTIIEVTSWMRIRRAGLEHAVLIAAEHGGQAVVSALISTRAVI